MIAARRATRGFSLLEFLLALALFFGGALGLLQAQLTGQMGLHAAMERTRAVAAAHDLLARIETNPSLLVPALALPTGRLDTLPPMPPVDCYSSPCLPDEIAAFDLWHWRSGVAGNSGEDLPAGGGGIGGAALCLQSVGATLSLAFAWRGRLPLESRDESRCAVAADNPAPAGLPAGQSYHRELQLAAYTVPTS